MSDEINMQSTSAEVDPILTNDLSDTSTESPIVPKNDYPMTVAKVEQSKSEKTGNNMIVVQLKSLNPITAINGETLPAGALYLFHRIVITPTEKMSAEQVKRNLKRFQVACGVRSGPFYPLDQYVGKNVMASVGISKATDDYPERNEIKGFVTS